MQLIQKLGSSCESWSFLDPHHGCPSMMKSDCHGFVFHTLQRQIFCNFSFKIYRYIGIAIFCATDRFHKIESATTPLLQSAFCASHCLSEQSVQIWLWRVGVGSWGELWVMRHIQLWPLMTGSILQFCNSIFTVTLLSSFYTLSDLLWSRHG